MNGDVVVARVPFIFFSFFFFDNLNQTARVRTRTHVLLRANIRLTDRRRCVRVFDSRVVFFAIFSDWIFSKRIDTENGWQFFCIHTHYSRAFRRKQKTSRAEQFVH